MKKKKIQFKGYSKNKERYFLAVNADWGWIYKYEPGCKYKYQIFAIMTQEFNTRKTILETWARKHQWWDWKEKPNNAFEISKKEAMQKIKEWKLRNIQ